MRIFPAGATGVLGKRLIPMLLERGHSITGTSNSQEKLNDLKSLGVEAVLMNGLDRDSVFSAVKISEPEVIVNEMTSLAKVRNYRNFDEEFSVTNRLRAQGTSHLLAAAKQVEARKIVVQSFAGWPFELNGDIANPEEVSFEAELPARMRQTQNAIRQMEQMVISSHSPLGVVLRYGYFYGPGTSFDPEGDITKAVRKRALPLIGGGTGAWSLIHVDDAANATRLAIESAPGGIYNITDDKPSMVSEWLPEFATILKAKRPMKIPGWLGKLLVGESGLYLMTRSRGALNSKAKRVLNWKPIYPDWHEGFSATLRRV